MGYLYGEEIKYEYDLIKPEDYELLQAFSCGNEKMDHFIHDEMIKDGIVDSDDGLPFKVWNSEKREVFAVDTKYQKLHMDKESEESSIPNEHRYFSDAVMIEAILHCRKIAEEMASARYIVLYADKKARRFYERNLFCDFSKYMEKENNMEINKNDPMYLVLD